ncbi:MAG: T9SS type A sorting domain-containing protein [Sphingobacteriales bacterium]|nr:MAG: T9SS type A sorting domain-containing protein [Sphingobacteriales bacterium]
MDSTFFSIILSKADDCESAVSADIPTTSISMTKLPAPPWSMTSYLLCTVKYFVMKTNFTRLLSFAAFFLTVLNLSAQDAYRTNVTDGVVSQWTTVGTWQRFDGVSWVAAGAIPTSADGVITIQTGDTIQLTGAASNISIDQVVIEPGAVLVIYLNSPSVTLNDGAGDDIIVNGKLYIPSGGNLIGTGNIMVNDGGQFTLRNSGILAVPLTNNGTMFLGAIGQAAGTILSTTVTNNDTCIWINGANTLSTNASFVNAGKMWVNIPANTNWASTGSNTITNSGTILNTTTFNLNVVPVFTNTGTLGGSGSYTFTNIPTNSGIIAPGASPGTMTVGPNTITGKTPSINIELFSDGAVQGTNYDHLIISNTVNITGATLNVVNTTTTADPINTTYTIITTSAGNITGPFATVNKPSNYTITYNANSIVLTKIAFFPLPLAWGEFKAVGQGSKVQLDWSTLMEENTAYFVIEHSTNSAQFTPVANVQAQGNSTYEARYKYTFASPDLAKTNYFRIKQVDIDGKSTYSVTRSVKFDKGQIVAIQAYPNPVKDVLTLNVQKENIQVLLADQSGKTIQRVNVQPGQHSINMQSLPTGVYQLAIFEKGVRIETKQIVKQ